PRSCRGSARGFRRSLRRSARRAPRSAERSTAARPEPATGRAVRTRRCRSWTRGLRTTSRAAWIACPMDLGLNGKIAVVTGASKGIGLAITQALADEGAHVVAGARTTDSLSGLEHVTPVAVDLAAPDGPAE